MATPEFKIIPVNATLQQGSPNSIELIVLDLDGAPVDVHTGFTAVFRYTSKSFKVNGQTGDLAGTYTYGADGKVKIVMTEVQTQGHPSSEQMPYQLLLSNDTFTTQAVAAKGNLLINQFVG